MPISPSPAQTATGARARSKLIDIHELSDWLGVTVGTLYNWVYQERIPFKKLGRSLRFAVDEIEVWLENQTTLVKQAKR